MTVETYLGVLVYLYTTETVSYNNKDYRLNNHDFISHLYKNLSKIRYASIKRIGGISKGRTKHCVFVDIQWRHRGCQYGTTSGGFSQTF